MTSQTFKPNALSIGRKIALQAAAIRPCPHCERHDLKTGNVAAGQAALVRAEDGRVAGRLKGSAAEVTALMGAVIAAAHDTCPECQVALGA